MATHRCPRCDVDIDITTIDLDPLVQAINQLREATVASFADLTAAVTAVDADIQRAITALQNIGGLTAEQQAQLDTAVATLQGDDTAFDAVSPDPAP